MKKIFMVLSACLVAALVIVSCGKDNGGKKDNSEEEGGEEQEEEFVPLIKIDGEFADWADITGAVLEGSNYAEFKVAMDEKNLYLYSKRTTGGRFADLWGGEGYYYYGFDLDGDPTNGEGSLWDNGPYDLLLLIFPFEGPLDAPTFSLGSGSDASPAEYTVANGAVAGKYTTDQYAEVEVSIPLEDLPELNGTQTVNIDSWGNKDANHIVYEGTIAM